MIAIGEAPLRLVVWWYSNRSRPPCPEARAQGVPDPGSPSLVVLIVACCEDRRRTARPDDCAVPPRIAMRSASLNPGVVSMESTAVFVQGKG
ncbi:MAG: hypothetical protein V3R80_03955 [Candidatus Tectomicrobia bacterium]